MLHTKPITSSVSEQNLRTLCSGAQSDLPTFISEGYIVYYEANEICEAAGSPQVAWLGLNTGTLKTSCRRSVTYFDIFSEALSTPDAGTALHTHLILCWPDRYLL